LQQSLSSKYIVLYSEYLKTTQAGPFGIKKTKEDTNEQADIDNSDAAEHPLVDLSDEDLMDVMEQFALMSDEERKEAFQEVLKMIGGEDDPEMIAALTEIMDATAKMDSYIESTMVEGDITIALELISQTDWKVIYNKRYEILDSLIDAGKINAADAEVYQNDEKEWEKELRYIWKGLQNQAIEGGNVVVAGVDDEEL
jgi:hypothetical protein